MNVCTTLPSYPFIMLGYVRVNGHARLARLLARLLAVHNAVRNLENSASVESYNSMSIWKRSFHTWPLLVGTKSCRTPMFACA